ncbi:MAG: hypothetical protein QOG03_2663 [Actinomycetota bacterium]|jgi:hypothetical protein|nr:hypothetical protein [Actinomycetota bacterium]
MGAREEVSIDIAASPATVYGLVSDLPRMGEWSPECVKCEWQGGATTAAPGAKFKGHNRIGARRWSTTGHIVTADAGHELAFEVTSVGGLKVAKWGYVIEPAGDGSSSSSSKVTEYTEDQRGAIMHVLGLLATGVRDRGGHNREGMQATLERIKVVAEKG